MNRYKTFYNEKILKRKKLGIASCLDLLVQVRTTTVAAARPTRIKENIIIFKILLTNNEFNF